MNSFFIHPTHHSPFAPILCPVFLFLSSAGVLSRRCMSHFAASWLKSFPIMFLFTFLSEHSFFLTLCGLLFLWLDYLQFPEFISSEKRWLLLPECSFLLYSSVADYLPPIFGDSGNILFLHGSFLSSLSPLNSH